MKKTSTVKKNNTVTKSVKGTKTKTKKTTAPKANRSVGRPKKSVAETTEHAMLLTATAVDDLGKKLIAKMRRGNVKFTFINRLGKEITTMGTLIKSKIPTTRKVAGATKPRDKEYVVFYDVLHGVRRQFNRNQVVAVFAQ